VNGDQARTYIWRDAAEAIIARTDPTLTNGNSENEVEYSG
jgi:hypothetical protein